MTSDGRLLSIGQVAELLDISESRARQLLNEHGVQPVTAYPATAVLDIHSSRAQSPNAGTVIPADAALPDTVIHEDSGWQVHPNLGMVYSIFPTRAPQLLGFIKNGHLAASRKYQDGSRREFRIARVVWEAVNRRPVPDGWVVIHRNGNQLDNRYSNLYLEPKRVIADPDHPSVGASNGRTARQRRSRQSRS